MCLLCGTDWVFASHFSLYLLRVNVLRIFSFPIKLWPYLTKGLMLVIEKGGVVLAVCGLIPSRTPSVFLRHSTIR